MSLSLNSQVKASVTKPSQTTQEAPAKQNINENNLNHSLYSNYIVDNLISHTILPKII